jgi:hypothetical protein
MEEREMNDPIKDAHEEWREIVADCFQDLLNLKREGKTVREFITGSYSFKTGKDFVEHVDRCQAAKMLGRLQNDPRTKGTF